MGLRGGRRVRPALLTTAPRRGSGGTRSPVGASPAPDRTGTGLLLLCLTGVVWGTIGPVVALLGERSDLSVLVVGGYRGVGAVLTLVAVVSVARAWPTLRRLVRESGRRVVATGILTALFQLLFFVGVREVGASVTTVVALGVAPVLLLGLATARTRRAPSTAEVLTVATALLGLVLVAGPGGGGVGPHALLGGLLALGSGAAYALATDVGSPLARRHEPLAVATGTTVVVALVLVPAGLLSWLAGGSPLTSADPAVWLLVAWLGVVTLALAYLLLYAGLRTTPSGTAVVATLLEPVTAVLLAVTLLGEDLTPRAALGCVLVLVAVAGLGRRRAAPA